MLAQLEMFGRSSTWHGSSKGSELAAVALQRKRVLSLEVELLEARLELGRLVYVRYEGVVGPDSDEDLRHDG